uniref:Prefoldin subunit n=1 Tax=Panagrolaimus sp. JU765 TaxID=591449 RepID=A0AC34Q632_9BILA
MSDDYDEQVKEGFTKLQRQVFESKQKIAFDEEIRQLKEKHCNSRRVILKKVNEHPEGNSVFRQIGRSFILSTKEDEIKRQESIIADYEADIKKIYERKEFIMKKLEEAQANMREMLAQRK